MRRQLLNKFGKIYYTVEYQQGRGFINTIWDGYATKNDIREACFVGLEVLEASSCKYKLNDNTEFQGPWDDMLPWLSEEWLPRAVKAGLRYLAHVALPGTFGEEAGYVMQTGEIGQQLEVRLFDNRLDALSWIRSCQEKKTFN